MPTPIIAGLVLAAGESSRMGRDKALLAYHGRTFLESVIATLREGGVERIAVVLGHHAAKIERSVNLVGVRVVINAGYRRGQTSSLQAGLGALESAELDAIVLCLVDHPAVSPEVIRTLVAAFRDSAAPMIVPTYGGERGHPVIISRRLFPELLTLSPGEGANSVVRKYHELTQLVEVTDRGILIDVDDPEAHQRLVVDSPNPNVEFMRIAIRKAEEGIAAGQSPFGAVIVRDDAVVAAAHNTVWHDNDPTAHAEVNAIRQAAKALGTIELRGCVIYSTCEPCPMCLAAIHWAKLDLIVYGAAIADAAASGFSELHVEARRLAEMGGSQVSIQAGMLEAECQALFEQWKLSGSGKTY